MFFFWPIENELINVFSYREKYRAPDEDAGWSTGGEDTDGGDVPPQVDPMAMAKGKEQHTW